MALNYSPAPNYTSAATKKPAYAPPPVSGNATVGGNTGSGSVLGANTSSAPMQSAPQQASIDYDALIRPALDALDSAIAPLQQGYQDTVSGITKNQETQKAQTNQSIGQQTGVVNQAKTTQQQYEESASDAARRQFSEIQQGLQARYGGTTGTGAFTSELAGSQTLRSLADIKTNAANAQRALDEKNQQIQEIGRIQLQDIDNQTQDQIAKAKNQLDLSLADIRNQKGQLLARKAELAANAMQQYQDAVNKVNENNTAFKQQLYLQQQQAQQSLAAAMEKASAISQAATPEQLVQYIQSLQPLVAQGYQPTVTQQLPGGGSLSLSQPKNDQSSTGLTPDELKQLGL